MNIYALDCLGCQLQLHKHALLTTSFMFACHRKSWAWVALKALHLFLSLEQAANPQLSSLGNHFCSWHVLTWVQWAKYSCVFCIFMSKPLVGKKEVQIFQECDYWDTTDLKIRREICCGPACARDRASCILKACPYENTKNCCVLYCHAATSAHYPR